ncbi:MAG: helix-turn-helix transcriptional regulator [Pseudomonadota bacterium]
MTTYQTLLTSEIDAKNLPSFWLSYFREKLRGEINDHLLEAFQESNLTKADIARKLNRRPEQITRWLSAPCNLETDTIADIALALGLAPTFQLQRIGNTQSNNEVHSLILDLPEPGNPTPTDGSVYVLENRRSRSMPGSAALSTSSVGPVGATFSTSEADILRRVS